MQLYGNAIILLVLDDTNEIENIPTVYLIVVLYLLQLLARRTKGRMQPKLTSQITKVTMIDCCIYKAQIMCIKGTQ